jgi:hypothetical protein
LKLFSILLLSAKKTAATSPSVMTATNRTALTAVSVIVPAMAHAIEIGTASVAIVAVTITTEESAIERPTKRTGWRVLAANEPALKAADVAAVAAVSIEVVDIVFRKKTKTVVDRRAIITVAVVVRDHALLLLTVIGTTDPLVGAVVAETEMRERMIGTSSETAIGTEVTKIGSELVEVGISTLVEPDIVRSLEARVPYLMKMSAIEELCLFSNLLRVWEQRNWLLSLRRLDQLRKLKLLKIVLVDDLKGKFLHHLDENGL